MPAKCRIFDDKMAKHEIIPCERCGSAIECKANSYTKCQCSVVQLSLNEMQYISEQHDGCLCSVCLFSLQQEYREMISPKTDSAENPQV
jgi:hypothetical protein